MNYTHISVYDQYCWQHGENVAGKIGGVWLKNYCPECNMDNYTHIEEQIAWLRKESGRIGRLIGERSNDGSYAHSVRRRKAFRGRVFQLNQSADTMTDMLAAVRAAHAMDWELLSTELVQALDKLDKP